MSVCVHNNLGILCNIVKFLFILALVHKLDKLYEFRELHLFRQEMQLFVKVMQVCRNSR